MRLSNSKAMREADRYDIDELKIPSTLLMSRAAGALAAAAAEHFGPRRSLVVFAGTGGNGGDGICAAALLLRQGASVRCLLVGAREKMTPDCLEMERRLIELGGALEDFDPNSPSQRESALEAEVIVDAIFGIGLNSPVGGDAKAAIELINESGAKTLSADIASGVSADSGAILGCAVRADETVTFSMAKPGHFVEPGGVYCGALRVADIGIPADTLQNAATNIHAVFPEDVLLPKRAALSHKGDYGRLQIIGGSVGLSGAPVLCAAAALRGGAGLVSLGVPEEIFPFTAPRLLEAMCYPLPSSGGTLSEAAFPAVSEKLSGADCAVIGCGLGRTAALKTLLRRIIETANIPLVLDADALFALGDRPDALKSAKHMPVLTPHEGEFARLGGALTGDRLSDALGFSKSRGCALVLKGHRVICAFPDGEAFIITAGNPGMAKGGSGDALAGLIGALLCQLPFKRAIVTACMIHALAGDRAADRLGEYSMLPEDLIAAIPEVMKSLTEDN